MKSILKTILYFFMPGKLILGRVSNNDKKIALTFDDGPHFNNTRKLLDILRSHGVSATFFVSGVEAEKYPDLINEIKRDGHEVGNHSYSHDKMSKIGFKKYKIGVERTSSLIGGSSFFRPPFGEISLSLLRFILCSDLKYIGWTIDSNDSHIKDKGKLIESMKSRNIKEGDIILFHEDYISTIDAMHGIISDLKARGFSPVKVSSLKG